MMSIRKMMWLFWFCTPLAIPNVFGFSGYLNVSIKGSVLAKPCSINNGQTIEIDFGDVMTTRIQDEFYKQPIDYTVSCTSGVQPKLNIFVDGLSASFNQNLLKTSVDDLAVLFKAGTNDFPLKSKLGFSFTSPPELAVVLVKKSGADLPAKRFTANATLKVEYQ